MAEASRELGKSRSTIITWEGWRSFPEELAFERDEQNRRYWSREQLELARAWVDRPGRRRSPKRYAT